MMIMKPPFLVSFTYHHDPNNKEPRFKLLASSGFEKSSTASSRLIGNFYHSNEKCQEI